MITVLSKKETKAEAAVPEIDESSIDMISEDLFGEEETKPEKGVAKEYICKECNSKNVDITEVYLSCENESEENLFMVITKIYARCLDCMFPQVVYSHMYEWDPSVVNIHDTRTDVKYFLKYYYLIL